MNILILLLGVKDDIVDQEDRADQEKLSHTYKQKNHMLSQSQ